MLGLRLVAVELEPEAMMEVGRKATSSHCSCDGFLNVFGLINITSGLVGADPDPYRIGKERV